MTQEEKEKIDYQIKAKINAENINNNKSGCITLIIFMVILIGLWALSKL